MKFNNFIVICLEMIDGIYANGPDEKNQPQPGKKETFKNGFLYTLG